MLVCIRIVLFPEMMTNKDGQQLKLFVFSNWQKNDQKIPHPLLVMNRSRMG